MNLNRSGCGILRGEQASPKYDLSDRKRFRVAPLWSFAPRVSDAI